MKIRIYSDSSACIGDCARLGNGKRMRHLEASDLWIQQIIRAGRAEVCNINGKLNPSDLFTKHLSRDEIIAHMSRLGFKMFDMHGKELGVKNQGFLREAEIYADRTREEYEDYDSEIATLFGKIKIICVND